VHAELRDQGEVVSEKTVAGLMAGAGIRGHCGRRRVRTTIPDKSAAPFPDLVGGDFTAPQLDLKWAGDITYVRTWTGWLFLATVIDLCSRRVIGWSMATHMRAELVCDALRMAVANRGGDVSGVIFHSDRGSQYTSGEFGEVCDEFGVRQSMGRRANAYDNAVSESWFASLKRELIYLRSWASPAQARVAIAHWIEATYNRRRRHSTIGMVAPCTFEARLLARPSDSEMAA
jgi:transposase InsO family protein